MIGTFVWDVIHGRDPPSAPVQEWGGITYALSAFDAALPPDWELVPLVKVGGDLAPQARDFLRGLSPSRRTRGPIDVPYRNNRVELFYTDAERRSEVLSGGVPGWSWLGLAPLVRDLDALYVNLISGFELDLPTAQLLRQNFAGPIYCDLHSIVLAVQPDGLRTLRPLPGIADWCRCFDLLQVNEDELAHDRAGRHGARGDRARQRRALTRRHARRARRGVLRGVRVQQTRRCAPGRVERTAHRARRISRGNPNTVGAFTSCASPGWR